MYTMINTADPSIGKVSLIFDEWDLCGIVPDLLTDRDRNNPGKQSEIT